MSSMKITQSARGINRLLHTEALPVIDPFCRIAYEGSISKKGDNADWDWYLYQDKKDEWVIFEAAGPGCIYNFTQHRYPSSPEAVFRFYTDGCNTPVYEISHSRIGDDHPFIRPLSDKYIGPEDNGRGPIRVVRSFLPIMFTKGCKVTSNIRLEGCEKAKGEGGWGHVTCHLYDAEGGTEYDPYTDINSIGQLNAKLEECWKLPKISKKSDKTILSEFVVNAGHTREIFNKNNRGTIIALRLGIRKFKSSQLNRIRIQIFWDGHDAPDVDAPIGTFFGNEYGHAPADIRTYMLGCQIESGKTSHFYNYFPMPFQKSAIIVIHNQGDEEVIFGTSEVYSTAPELLTYDFSKTGYFVSSPYYGPCKNKAGENTVIADISGVGHMVYGTISGYGISTGGCEGDVRVFVDGKKSPSVESDGSESWASYGWGFVTPPQCNPFSAYHGAEGVNSDWSEVRLTIGDSYCFLDSLRFELEHGDINDGMGMHSGQIFCYVLPDTGSSLIQTDEYIPSSGFELRNIRSAYPNGMNDKNTFEASVAECPHGRFEFAARIDPYADGLLLRRSSCREKARQGANVYVNGRLVSDRPWISIASNPFFSWYDDDYLIHSEYFTGKNQIQISIEPIDIGEGLCWNAASIKIYSIKIKQNMLTV